MTGELAHRADLGFLKGCVARGFYSGTKKCSNWLIHVVVQCTKHTQHAEHSFCRGSRSMPSQETLTNL